MKNLGVILVSAVTVPILLLVGGYLLWPPQQPPQPAVVIAIDADLAPVKARLANREAEQLAQLEATTRALQQQRAAFDAQTETWLKDMAAAQNRLTNLEAQVQAVQAQVAQLEITRTTRLANYQTELAQTRQKYQTQLDQLYTQLADMQRQLAQLNGQPQPPHPED